jgi:hypothetical protein
VPGSRFHRFLADDVERLKRQRGATVVPASTGRRVVGPELVDASSLHQWAATKDAQSRLPELVRRLLASTPGISQISVRAGEGTALSGWDGRAESEGTSFLPAGTLRLEIGVGQRPKKKADEDFEKRRAEPQARSESFVFITPRRWSGGAKWAEERSKQGAFAGVLVLDADDLEGWLHATPAAHYWISERLGRSPEDGQTLDQWWERFHQRTSPPLPRELFVAGRDAYRKQLLDLVGGPADVVSVRAAWVQDAMAFIAAALIGDDGSDDFGGALPLVVRSPAVWNRVIQQAGRMVLIPTFDEPDIAGALRNEHHVVVPIDHDGFAQGACIALPSPGRLEAQKALEQVDVLSERSYDLAALARRSMPSLLRKLARDPRFAKPPWAQPPSSSVLAPLLLVGRWTGTAEDRAVVERVTNQDWESIEKVLRQWHKSDDPPFVLAGGEWHVSSADEAFLLLSDLLTSDALARWESAAIDVLLEQDPRADLAESERPMANILGATRAYSDVMRRGMAEGVALLGAAEDANIGDDQPASRVAGRVVGAALGRAAEDVSGKVWASLTDVLPLLAEAAPSTFLDAVHNDLDRIDPILAAMFQDGQDTDPLFSSSPHTGLLWALEGLCWSDRYLASAADALARLDEVDPGGRLSNRPLGSLDSVCVGWVRHTGVSTATKLDVVRRLAESQPDTTWKLVLRLWPSGNSVSSPPHAPRFRDWRPDRQRVAMGDYFSYVDGLVTIGEQLAGDDPDRWAVLVTRLGPLPAALRERLCSALSDLVGGGKIVDQDGRLRLWEAIQTEVARHRRFGDAEWSMSEEALVSLDAVAQVLHDTSRPERFAFLFDWRPHLPGIDLHDHEQYNARLRVLRNEAILSVLGSSSLDGVSSLARRAAVPRHMGPNLAEVLDRQQDHVIVDWLVSDDDALVQVAGGFVLQRAIDRGTSWVADTLDRIDTGSIEHRLRLALSVPANGSLWDLLEASDTELNASYWARASITWVDPEDAERAVLELMAHDRPWAGIDLLALMTVGPNAATDVLTEPLVVSILDQALQNDTETPTSQSVGYEVGVLLDRLEELRTDADVIARYEYAFFGLLRHNRKPRALGAALASDPSLFVTLVKQVYRAKHERALPSDDRNPDLARHAWTVLNDWDDRDDDDAGASAHGWLPGLKGNVVDPTQLTRWVREARDALAQSDRADVGDECIGNVLARSPVGDDGIWPAEAIRDLIEEVGSVDIETGVYLGVVNGRVITSRGAFEGGDQERELAKKYRAWERDTAGRWRRTSRILRRLADNYEEDARREDNEADRRSDLE